MKEYAKKHLPKILKQKGRQIVEQSEEINLDQHDLFDLYSTILPLTYREELYLQKHKVCLKHKGLVFKKDHYTHNLVFLRKKEHSIRIRLEALDQLNRLKSVYTYSILFHSVYPQHITSVHSNEISLVIEHESDPTLEPVYSALPFYFLMLRVRIKLKLPTVKYNNQIPATVKAKITQHLVEENLKHNHVNVNQKQKSTRPLINHQKENDLERNVQQ